MTCSTAIVTEKTAWNNRSRICNGVADVNQVKQLVRDALRRELENTTFRTPQGFFSRPSSKQNPGDHQAQKSLRNMEHTVLRQRDRFQLR